MFLNRFFGWLRRWVGGGRSPNAIEPPPTRSVLRLIPKAWYHVELTHPIEWVAFKPRENENDGISVYDAEVTTPAQLDAASRKPGTFYIARLRIEDLSALGLSVQQTPGHVVGHLIVPELSRSAYERNKPTMKEVFLKLANLASQDIVHRPSSI